jgi:hypothetical protein
VTSIIVWILFEFNRKNSAFGSWFVQLIFFAPDSFSFSSVHAAVEAFCYSLKSTAGIFPFPLHITHC